MDRNAVLQESKLLQPLTFFQGRLRKRYEAIERWLAVGVEAKMFVIDGLGAIAIVGNRSSGELQGSTGAIGHDLHGVGICNIHDSGPRF